MSYGLIFDVDGVIADSETVNAKASEERFVGCSTTGTKFVYQRITVLTNEVIYFKLFP